MPILHPCSQPGCPELTLGGPCVRHLKSRAAARPTTKQAGYTGAWVRLRAMILRDEPVCRPCWTGILIPNLDLVEYDNVAKRWKWIGEPGESMGIPAYYSGHTEPATQLDHIIPMSQGGARLDPRNLQPCCQRCNVRKAHIQDS